MEQKLSATLELKHNLKDKYVAFLDVMGFSNLVNSGRIEPLESYFEKINEVLGKLKRDKANIQCFMISDSIILIAPDDLSELRQLFSAIRRIHINLLWRKILVRGAVSFGQIYYNPDKNIIVGKAFIKAYNLEKDMAIFPRVIVDPIIVKRLGQDRTAFPEQFKSGSVYEFENRVIYNQSSFSRISEDAIFIDYACKVIKKADINGCLKHTYAMIVDNLYGDQRHYTKYIWLKNYFIECMQLTLSMLEKDPTADKKHMSKIAEWQDKFVRL